MATKAEQARVEVQRSSARMHAAQRQAKHRKLAARKRRPASQESDHAGRKATHALEVRVEGVRPSRKSSRKGANRLRADAPLNVTAETGEGTAKFRHAATQVGAKRVRGRR